MNIYQEPVFEVVDNVTTCTLNCKLLVHLNGKKAITKSFTVHAKSKCHPDDTFDEVYGKRLSESRASFLAYNKSCKIIKELKKDLDALGSEFERNIKKLEYLSNEEEKHLEIFKDND